MKRTIIVTGASGTLGAELSNSLEKQGHRVILRKPCGAFGISRLSSLFPWPYPVRSLASS